VPFYPCSLSLAVFMLYVLFLYVFFLTNDMMMMMLMMMMMMMKINEVGQQFAKGCVA